MTIDTRQAILVLNRGSSSLKYAAFDIAAPDVGPIVSGQVEPTKADEAFVAVDHALAAAGQPPPIAVGHRIVHGGSRLLRHRLIDMEVTAELEAATTFAPLHLPAAMALLRRATARYPGSRQIACFDTAFHADMSDVARTLPIPRELRDAGLHRYGFHGLSCESIVHQLGTSMPKRVVIAHLGNGASVTAVRGGQSIDTSMGLTPSGGVMMGTRCGDIDPGVLVHLMRVQALGASDLEEFVNQRSGMLGVSGLSGDMRRLRGATVDSDADLAIRMFCRSVSKQVAGMMTALGGADLLVFTGGIGEHDEAVRGAICADLAWAGVGSADDLAGRPPGCRVLTLPAREEEQIARHACALLFASGAKLPDRISTSGGPNGGDMTN